MQRSHSPSREPHNATDRIQSHRLSQSHQHRNRLFPQTRQPLRDHTLLQIAPHGTTGPVSFLNPTRAHFQPHGRRLLIGASEDKASPHTSDERAVSSRRGESYHGHGLPGVSFKWTSRNNRKGRHAIALGSSATASKHTMPPFTNSFTQILAGIQRMCTRFPIWDISYDVATVFTFGSVIWVVNAFFVYLPLVQPSSEFKNEELYGGGITAFIGATVFEFGSFLLMAEAVNENRAACFGWALEKAISRDTEEGADGVQLRPSKSTCTHHHYNKRNLVGKGAHGMSCKEGSEQSSSSSSDVKSWVWFPSKQDLRTHYRHDLGFLASFAQLIGATIFWISGLTALPGIYDHMSRPIAIIFYWTPQVLGGTGFIISGTLFMLETQSHWYKPAFGTLGWWIGAWNLIGGIGFTICPAFGYDKSSWAQYQACLSTFWGSWAFLIGSVIQWYESLDKYPVESDCSGNSDGK